MKRRSRTISRPSAGLTLIESLAGTALMGTLLVAILVAGARLTAQATHARLRMEACKAAEELVAAWRSEKSHVIARDEGDVPGRDGWKWRTRAKDNPVAEMVKAQVVCLEITAPSEELPLVQLEMVVPKDEIRATTRSDPG